MRPGWHPYVEGTPGLRVPANPLTAADATASAVSAFPDAAGVHNPRCPTMIIVSDKQVAIKSLTLRGVAQVPNGLNVDARIVLDLDLDVSDAGVFTEARSVIAAAIADGLSSGNADGGTERQKNRLVIGVGRDFPLLTFRFCAVGQVVLKGESSTRVDLSGARIIDRVADVIATTKAAQVVVVNGVPRLRMTLDAVMLLETYVALTTMVGLETVTLTTSLAPQAQGDLFESAESTGTEGGLALAKRPAH